MVHHQGIWVAAALVISACNISMDNLPTPNAENLIVVTATPQLPTPDADGVIYVTTTPVPAFVDTSNTLPAGILPPTEVLPTLPPTPFEQPTEALAQATRQLTNGYYEEAAQTFTAILNQGDLLAPEIRSEAAFKLGEAALKEGLFDQAVSAYTQLITLFPNDSRVPQAHFLRGDAYLGLSRWAEAIADFQQFLALRPGLIDSYAYERIADADLASGQLESALTNYTQAITANRALVQLLLLREKLARILISEGRVTEGVAQYDAILEVAKNAGYRASVDLLAAQALIAAGDTTNGLARARRIFDSYPDTPSAYTAVQLLGQGGLGLDGYQRGKVAFNYGDYATAISAFNEYSSTVTLDKIPADLYLMLGRAYREIGNSDAAIIAFQTIVQQYPNDPLFGDALLEQGRTRFLSGDITGAIETYLTIGQRYPALSQTPEAIWRAGYLYGTNNDPVRSREVFTQLATQYPTSSWASNGLFLAATAAMNAEEWSVAENLYGRIAAISTGEDQAAAYLWVGRLAQQRGDTAGAQSAFQMAQQAAPESFFAIRAADISNGVEPFTPPSAYNFTFDEVADRAAADVWLRANFAVTQQGDLSIPSPTLQADGRLARGRELWQVGAYNEAVEEFKSILDDARAANDAVTSYQMALILRDLGEYQSSIVAAADVIIASGQPTLQAPALIARLRYPAYYSELVLEQANAYGYDPLVQFALIRQESLYNPNAVSSAGASGLSQVMPATGRYIAQQLGYTNFNDSDLFRPHLAIEFGAEYIAEQLNLFDGNVAATLAAYNAGPGRAIDWVELSGGSFDALILTIQFEETKLYLERIYNHYAIYKALYGG